MIASPDDPTPTVLGLLMLSSFPHHFIPGAKIQFLRINGIELHNNVIDNVVISGNIVDQLIILREKISKHNKVSSGTAYSLRHKINYDYPIIAIDQIICNAILHRNYAETSDPIRVNWYNNHIEIISPGGPFGSVDCSNFGKPGITDYRNPNLASALKTLGFVQPFGRGIVIARKTMEQNGNPAPEFFPETHFVRCILRKNK